MNLSNINLAFKKARMEKRPALLTYTVAGDNNKKKSLEILKSISKFVDICEIGFPHNTPIADGGQIQTSAYRAIKNGIKIKNVFQIVKDFKKSKTPTKDARDILPKKIDMKNFVNNMANACLIASAFSTNNYKLFSRSLKDTIIEPVRSTLIPGFDEVKAIALEAGADGVSISGAGPAIFAITNTKKKAPIIEDAMARTFQKNGIDCITLITTPSQRGSVEIS